MKWLRRVLIGIALLVASVAACIAWLVATDGGSRWFGQQLMRYVPGLTAELSGQLSGPLYLRHVGYRGATFYVALDSARLDWQPAALWNGSLAITALQLDGLHVVQYGAPEPKPATTSLPLPRPPPLALPIGIALDKLEIRNVVFDSLADATRPHTIVVDSLTAQATLDDTGLNLVTLDLRMPNLSASVTGRSAVQRDYASHVEAQLSADVRNLGPIQGQLTVDGSPALLQATGVTRLQWRGEPIEADFDVTLREQTLEITALRAALPQRAARVASSGAIHLTGTAPTAKLTGTWNDLKWPLDKPAVASRRGRFTVSGALDAYEFSADADVQPTPLPPLRVTAAGAGDLQHLTKLNVTAATGDTELRLQGNVDWRTTPSYAAAGTWRNLQWPLADTALVQSGAGHLHVGGEGARYVFAVDGDVAGPQIPAGAWIIGASGDAKGLNLASIDGAALAGTIQGDGAVQWSPQLRWNGQLRAAQIDLSGQWPELPSRLSLAARSQGELAPGQPLTMTVDVSDLGGTLQQVPVTGLARIALADHTWRIEPLVVGLGRGHIAVQGEAGAALNLSLSADAPNLSGFHPALHGSATVFGSVTGTRQVPRLTARAGGRNIGYAQYRADALHADVDVDLSNDPQAHSTLQILATDLHLAEQTLDAALVDASGSTHRHEALVAVVAGARHARVTAAGRYEGGRWSGTVADAELALDPFGTWRTTNPGAIEIDANRARLARWCWSSEHGELCLEGANDPEHGLAARADVPELALSMLEPWLPAELLPKGSVSAAAAVRRAPDGVLSGEAAILSARGKLTIPLPDQSTHIVEYRDAQLTAQLDADQLQLRANVDAAPLATLSAEARIDAAELLSAPRGAAVTGHADAKINDLALVAAFVQGIDSARGAARAQLTATGTLGAPSLAGELRLTGGQAQLGPLGIELKEVEASAQLSPPLQLRLHGSARSGEGQLRIGGQADFAEGSAWQGALTISGERFLLTNLPESYVLIAPELAISASAREFAVNGVITVPEAMIKPRETRGARGRSPDVVVIEDQAAAPPTPAINYSSVLRFELGDFVRIDGFGLRARLGGSLVLVKAPPAPLTAIGEVRVESGEYRAYGQRLAIERGRIVFIGGPPDDPGLDIRATRTIETVTAGVDVRGTLRAPELTVFSTPAMDESEVLSYLILGRPLRNATSDEQQQVSQAGAGLTLLGGELLADRVGERFGIEEVAVESDATGETSLVVGKQVSPKLYVGYGMGLVEHVNSFRIRYELTKHWSIEAETAATYTAADILYTLDTD